TLEIYWGYFTGISSIILIGGANANLNADLNLNINYQEVKYFEQIIGNFNVIKNTPIFYIFGIPILLNCDVQFKGGAFLNTTFNGFFTTGIDAQIKATSGFTYQSSSLSKLPLTSQINSNFHQLKT